MLRVRHTDGLQPCRVSLLCRCPHDDFVMTHITICAGSARQYFMRNSAGCKCAHTLNRGKHRVCTIFVQQLVSQSVRDYTVGEGQLAH